MPDISSSELGINFRSAEKNRQAPAPKIKSNPSKMQGRRYLRGTDIPAGKAISVGAGLALVASGLGMSVDAAAQQFESKGQYDTSPSVIVEPVSAKSAGEAPIGAHPQKYAENTPQLVDNRMKESDPQIRVGVIAEVFPNLSADKFKSVSSEIDSVYAQMEKDGVFGDMKEIIGKYDSYIALASKKYNIPKDILYGVFVTETSGNLDAMHDSDAVGPGIMPAAAEELGIRLEDRAKPEVAFDAMANYLDKYRKIFGNDLGIGIANYYAGPGNVSEMIRVDAAGRNMKDPGEIKPENYGNYANALRGRSAYDLLNDSGVRNQVLRRLDPKTPEYPLRVAAGAENYRRALR